MLGLKEDLKYNEVVKIVGVSSKYLTYAKIYSYVLLNFIFVMSRVVATIDVCGYITSAFSMLPVTHRVHEQTADAIDYLLVLSLI